MNLSAEIRNYVPGNDRAATLSDQGNDDRITPDPAGIHFGTHNVYYVKLYGWYGIVWVVRDSDGVRRFPPLLQDLNLKPAC